ncbi:penicillin-binding transpeptidase domain-containing protein [Patescibacteria group bacterium]
METLSATQNNESLLVLSFLFIFARLFELQIIKGDYFKKLSEGNRIRKVRITAPRGKVYARGGEVLIGNKEVQKKIEFLEDGEIVKTDAFNKDENDILITEYERTYSLKEAFLHVGGYVSEANENEVGKINPKCSEKGAVKLGSLVGRGGLESIYECELSGIDGEELIEVDTKGRKVRVLGIKEPVAGKDIKTSIDFELQKELPVLMEDKKGAIVVSDSKGQVNALYSNPSFDPNFFGKREYFGQINQALNSEDLPLFNRAIGGLYHPGSVFKPVVTIAALSEGKIDEDYTYEDKGVITVNEYSYANWYFNQYGRTEGEIGIKKAIARSTDTFFYKIGEYLGPDYIAYWAKKFGLGKTTNIDLPGEIQGLIPSPSWKYETKGEQWFLGNTYHISIGQGDLSVTPVEMNAATSVISNGGKLCSLNVKKQKSDSNCEDLKIDSNYLNIVKEGMIDACSTGGTGYTFFDFEPKVACKTGTAETNVDGKTHAWFTVFAPHDFADIVVTVLVEGGGEGSKIAGPIARDIFDFWFHRPDYEAKKTIIK